jgi:hypothetical protein
VGLRLAYDVVETLPRNATCREIIGYIAGLNGGFAKFSRDGVLLLKKLRIFNNVSLTRDRYNELSLKADPLEIRQIDFIAGDDAFTAGAGTKLSTYRQINPFANQTATDRVFHEWKGFSYHGMTVKMRGLPYLESGDSIYVQDDFEDKYYLAVISDYTLEYDGGLRGRLVSKSKNPIDDFDEPMSGRSLVDSITDKLRLLYTDREVVSASILQMRSIHLQTGFNGI